MVCGARQLMLAFIQAEALALTRGSTYGPLAAYLALSLAYFGLPVASHFGDDWRRQGHRPADLFVWSLAWWRMRSHWQNPVVTHASGHRSAST
jgi:hypothetical protein